MSSSESISIEDLLLTDNLDGGGAKSNESDSFTTEGGLKLNYDDYYFWLCLLFKDYSLSGMSFSFELLTYFSSSGTFNLEEGVSEPFFSFSTKILIRL